MPRVLFIYSRNRLRSPTAERVFAKWSGVETDSAGLSPGADCPLTADQPLQQHRSKLAQRFKGPLKGKRWSAWMRRMTTITFRRH